jgi:hypothetical protein
MSRNPGVTIDGTASHVPGCRTEIFGNMPEPEAKSSNVELLNGNAHHSL